MLEDAILNIEKLLLDPFALNTAMHITVDVIYKIHLKIKSDDKVMVSLTGDDLIDLILQAGKDAKNIVNG